MVQPDHRVPVRPAVPAAVPELALPGRPGHLGERADVRRSAAVAGRVPRAGPGGAAGRTGCPGPSWLAPLAFIFANLLIYWTGFEVLWKLGHRDRCRLRADRHLHGVRPAAAAAGLEVRAVAAGLPDRHGHHLLAGPVQRRSPRKHPLPPTNTFNIPFWWDMLVVAGVQPDHLLLGAGYGCPGRKCSIWSTGRAGRRLSCTSSKALSRLSAVGPILRQAGASAFPRRRSARGPGTPGPVRHGGRSAAGAAAKRPVAQQDPAFDQRRPAPAPNRRAVHGPGGRVGGFEPPAAGLTPRRALHDQHLRAPRVAGQHDLARAGSAGSGGRAASHPATARAPSNARQRRPARAANARRPSGVG